MNPLVKKGIALLVYSYMCSLHAQPPATPITYDQLNSNTSAAFVLMGISPTEIATPTNVGEFAASVQDATENLSVLPENYAVEVPLVSEGSGIDKVNILTMSAGYARETAEDFIDSKVGIGLKFSPLCPEPDDNSKNNELATKSVLSLAASESSLLTTTAKIGVANTALWDKFELDQLYTEDCLRAPGVDKKSAQNGRSQLNRKGWVLDLHAGIAFDLGDNSFDNVAGRRVGMWTNFGYELPGVLTFLGTGKALLEKVYSVADTEINETNTSLDFGGRCILKLDGKKLQVSAEGLYRHRSLDMLGNSWKGVIDLSYDLPNNKRLTLAIGKDFDNDITKQGNLISLLNYVQSFGNEN